MRTIAVELSLSQILSLNGNNDTNKGKVIEELVKDLLYKLGADKVDSYFDRENQVNLGDLKARAKNKIYNIEVKSSHSYNNSDKLALDIEYFNFNNGKIVPYIQKTTDTSKGWLYISQADWLIAFNVESSKLYIIKQFQKLKKQIKEEIENHELYLSLFTNNIMELWTDKEFRNINKYLTCGVKKDTTKYTKVLFLELSEESLNYYNVKYDIIKVEIQKSPSKLATEGLNWNLNIIKNSNS